MNAILPYRFYIAVFLFCVTLVLPAQNANLRERSNLHFGVIDWATSSENHPAVAITGVSLPGGNESFPVLAGIRGNSKISATAISAVYPREERLGTLDYSSLEPQLLSFLLSVSENLGRLKLDPSLCDPLRPFISVLAEYRLVRLPSVQSVLFSKPQTGNGSASTVSGLTAKGPAEVGGQIVVFRLLCRKDEKSVPVYLMVTAVPVSSTWKITEVLFDGESYAGLAQPY